MEGELQEALVATPLRQIFNMHNTTGYSVLHVACSNFEGNYAMLLLQTILDGLTQEEARKGEGSFDSSEDIRKSFITWLNQRTE